MTYRLVFVASAKKEWQKLGATIRTQFKKKLRQRLEAPHVRNDRLRGSTTRYKIKLRASGNRLVYEVIDDELVVEVISVGKRNRSVVYRKAAGRRGNS